MPPKNTARAAVAMQGGEEVDTRFPHCIGQFLERMNAKLRVTVESTKKAFLI